MKSNQTYQREKNKSDSLLNVCFSKLADLNGHPSVFIRVSWSAEDGSQRTYTQVLLVHV